MMRKFLLLLLASIILLGGCGPNRSVTEADNALPVRDKSIILLWNEVALSAVRHGKPQPTIVTRTLFMLHTAIYDAWAMYDATAVPVALDAALRRPAAEHTLANKEAAVSYAAYHLLVEQYPVYEAETQAFRRLLTTLGYQVTLTQDTTTPAGVGQAAAQAIITDRQNDGSNAAGGYADIASPLYPIRYAPVNSPNPDSLRTETGEEFNPNHWQPLRVPTGNVVNSRGYPIVDERQPSSYTDQKFLTPHWGAVRPFALTRGDQFRPIAPPQYGSSAPYTDALGQTMTNEEAYRAQFTQVLSYSAHLHDGYKVVAEYWADGPRSETPPGHWNSLAQGISLRDHHSLDEDVKMFFALNAALFDGAIACWDAKRIYDFIRPQSAIRFLYEGQNVEAWGGPDQGTQLIQGEEWRPYQALNFVTPGFPEYISGHSTFSAAAAEVLTRFTGSNQFYDGVTQVDQDFNNDGLDDMLGEYVATVGSNKFEDNTPAHVIILRWPTFQDAADEAGLSRLYGGIHIQDGDLRGRALGRAVADQAYILAEQYWTGQR